MNADQARDALLYAFIADGDTDGIVSVQIAGFMVPLVSRGRVSVMSHMRELAQRIAQDSGQTIRLYEFTTAREVETFRPGPVQ